MAKLKKKLATATGAEREKILYKIKRLSPWWLEPGTVQPKKAPAEKKASAPAPKPKGPPRPKSDKPAGPSDKK